MRTGIILAGGASSRFGSDKAFALWEGQTFLARVAAALFPHVGELIILARADVPADRYQAEAPGALVLPDRGKSGPVAALHDALPVIQGDQVIVAACDAPGLDGETVARLLAHDTALLVDARADRCAVFTLPTATLRMRLAAATRLLDLARDGIPLTSRLDGLDVDESTDFPAKKG